MSYLPGLVLKSIKKQICFLSRITFRVVVLSQLLLLESVVSAAPTKTSLEISGLIFPCVNCELTSEGAYKITIRGEEYLLRPFEARKKLFETTSADQLSKSNKTGDLLRFLLSQEVRQEEAERAIQGLISTDGGRSTFILSFDSIYQSHQRAVLKLLVTKQFLPEVFEGIKKSSVASSDSLLEMCLIALSGQGDISSVVEKQLDGDLSITLERLGVLEQMLKISEIEPVTKKVAPQLAEFKSAIENTSDSMSSSYREAGLPPSIRRVMRKQRLLTLTGSALQATPEDAEKILIELTNAWDAKLDTPSIHEAFRHLIELAPNANAVLEPIRDELMARDTTIQLMLNPPPPIESSLIALGGTLAGIILIVVLGLFSYKKRWRLEQRTELRDGLSFDERKELQSLLAHFDLSGDVSLEDLKQAYRKKAKEHHPDSQISPDGTAETGDSFIELQQVYARARELISAFSR
jgi:hypothetical protein